jgi:hypothetical protein
MKVIVTKDLLTWDNLVLREIPYERSLVELLLTICGGNIDTLLKDCKLNVRKVPYVLHFQELVVTIFNFSSLNEDTNQFARANFIISEKLLTKIDEFSIGFSERDIENALYKIMKDFSEKHLQRPIF